MPSRCPLARVSTRTDAEVSDVSWASRNGTVTEEFRVDADAGDEDGQLPVLEEADAVLDVDDERIYQFTRERNADCACEVVEALGCPVADVRADAGTLVLTLHLPALARLREVVAELGETAESVQVQYLVHDSIEAGDGGDRPTVVDFGRLTDRQREVIETAFQMGYFEYPRDSNGTEVAESLGIDLSTFTEHLAAAQSKLLAGLLERAPSR